MTTKLKTENKEHAIRLLGELERCEAILVKGGPQQAYLWIGHKVQNGDALDFFDGEALVDLAKAILAEMEVGAK